MSNVCRSDKTLQDLVYKLVPGLFQGEHDFPYVVTSSMTALVGKMTRVDAPHNGDFYLLQICVYCLVEDRGSTVLSSKKKEKKRERLEKIRFEYFTSKLHNRLIHKSITDTLRPTLNPCTTADRWCPLQRR